MVKNLTQPTFFASVTPPNHKEITYWIDLGANARGNIIKFWDGNIQRWVKLTDASSEYAVAPSIGANGNWFVDNRDTGVSAAGYPPYVGDNGNWWAWDATLGKYIDTGVPAEGPVGPVGPVGPQGKSAYEVALDNAFVGTEDEWLASLRKASEDAAELANAARDAAILATTDSIEATAETRDATANAKSATIDAVMSAANAGNAADTARTSAIAANNAAASANLSANAANTAAATANTAVDAANTATQNANLATVAADAVVSEAHVAIDEINDKLVKADTAIADANTSAGNADTAAGNANASAATANSAAQVALDAAANVKDGKTPVIGEISAASVATDQPAVFELTNSGQIDEHGNPIYIGSAEFPIGADGKSPFMETGTTTTGNAGTNANVVVTPNGSTADGRPKFKLDFTIPRGATGEPGSGSGNAVIVNFADATNSKQYVLKPQADGSLNYILEEVDITLSDELSVVYVSKTGNDTNSGRNILHPKLTISNAVTTASALITGATTKASVVVIDAGVYTETISLVDDVSLVAERATIVGRINLRNRTRVSVHAHYAAASSTYMLYKDGTDHAYYNAVISDGRGLAGTLTANTNLYNITASSITFIDVQLMFVSTNGVGVREESSTIGHIHFNIKDLYLAGNNATGIRASGTASNIIGYFDHILKVGSNPTSTIAIDVRNTASIVKVTGGEIVVDTAYSILAGSLYLTCPKITGATVGTAVAVSLEGQGLESLNTTDQFTLQKVSNNIFKTNPINSNSVNFKAKEVTATSYSNVSGGINLGVAEYRGDDILTGTMLITLPNGWTNSMNTYRLNVSEYLGRPSIATLLINGYNYLRDSNWENAKIVKLGRFEKNIRLGYVNGKCCILLGSVDTIWRYTSIKLDVLTSYVNMQLWKSGYTFSVITDESEITNIVTPPIESRTVTDAELNAKATKLSIPNNTVPINSSGATGEANDNIPYTISPTINTLALRTTGGQLRIGTAVLSDAAVQKAQLDTVVSNINTAINEKASTEYVNTQLANKGSKLLTSAYSVPYNSSSAVGEPTSSVRMTASLIGETIPYRTATGQIRVGDPLIDADATTKKYVDALISTKGNVDIINSTTVKKDVPYVMVPTANAAQTYNAVETVVGGRNLLMNYNDPAKFVRNGGSVLTKTVEEVPDWGATDANRIVSSGGTSIIKAVCSFGVLPEGVKRTASVWVKNNSDKILNVGSNLGSLTINIAPSESKLVIFRYPTTGGSQNAQIQFRAPSVSDNIDVTWWRVMYEEGHIPSTAVPAVDDYYENGNLKANGLTLSGVQKLDKPNIKIYKNVAEWISRNVTHTGAVVFKCIIPHPNMLKFKISIWRYSTKLFGSAEIRAYRYKNIDTPWHDTVYSVIGDIGGVNIRLGLEGEYACIVFGSESGTWDTFSRITIDEIQSTLYDGVSDISHWTAGVMTDLSNITNITTPNLVSRTVSQDELDAKAAVSQLSEFPKVPVQTNVVKGVHYSLVPTADGGSSYTLNETIVGARNLFRNSGGGKYVISDVIFRDDVPTAEIVTIDGVVGIRQNKVVSSTLASCRLKAVTVKPDTHYSIGLWIYIPDSVSYDPSLYHYVSGDTYAVKSWSNIERNKWTFISDSFVTKSGYIVDTIHSNFGNGIVISDLMYTEGSIPNTWSPAPEDKLNVTDVINNLTSTDTNKPLSAAQGKMLQDSKQDSFGLPGASNFLPIFNTLGFQQWSQMSQLPSQSTLLMRAEGGQARVGTAVLTDAAVPKAQMDALLAEKADLDGNGLIPISQLPSYVSDVIEGIMFFDEGIPDEFRDVNNNVITPENSKIYVDVSTDLQYRWGGSLYTEISKSLALGTTANTAFAGNRGLALEIGKVDKVSGKGLSTNDFTDEDKAEVLKVADLETKSQWFDTHESLTDGLMDVMTARSFTITASSNIVLTLTNLELLAGNDLRIRVVSDSATARTITLPTGVTNETGMETAVVTNVNSLELNIAKFGSEFIMKGVLYE